jgi:hypothetical protein
MYTNVQISILLRCYAGDPNVSKFIGLILWTIMSHDETLRMVKSFFGTAYQIMRYTCSISKRALLSIHQQEKK